MTSYASGSCCIKGVKHEGEPVGSFSTLTDFEIYTSFPSDSSTDYGILFLTDFIGHRFVNSQLIADQFAVNGYFVMMPDLFYGDSVPLNRPEGFDTKKWRDGGYNEAGRPHLAADIDPIINTCLTEMRTTYNCKKIGAVGYCFGAKYVVRYLKPNKDLIDAGYLAHPSFVEADELRLITGPLAISAAEVDHIFPPEKRYETELILKELGLPYQINLYSQVQHGFAVRGNLDSRVVQYAKESAFLQAVQWFEEHLRR